MTQPPDASPTPVDGPQDVSWLVRVVRLSRAVADADPALIVRQARQLGSSRRYLAPIAWAAGTLVLMLRGVRLLLLNWRLTIVQLVPAIVIWVAMYDLRVHALHRADFRNLSTPWVVAVFVVSILLCIASFWCNTVFAFAIETLPPRIRPAVHRTRHHLRPVVLAGLVVGAALGFATTIVPKLHVRLLVFDLVLAGVLAVMFVSFVSIPARILARRKQRLPPREAMGRTVAGWALSAVVMTPGFLLDRLGIVLMGVPRLRIIGFLMLTLGTALYAAGMSTVKAIKLSILLATPEDGVDAGSPATDGARTSSEGV